MVVLRIFDAHCDLLYKLWGDPTIHAYNDATLQISIQQLLNTHAKVQCFALFVPEEVPFTRRKDVALAQISIFYKKVLEEYDQIKLVLTGADVLSLKEGEIGAILTLEGCDAIGDDLETLDILHRLGVRSVGLTWNYANLVADGVKEKRNGGITNFGRNVIHWLNDKRLWTDLSHSSERSFWDAIEMTKFPIASHSNSYKLCPHDRNLRDEQIKALIHKNGMIGITFVPFFTSQASNCTIKDVITHLDYVCSLGGVNNVGFGSDFDGIDETITGLSNYASYMTLVNTLHQYYSNDLVDKFTFRNFAEHISY